MAHLRSLLTAVLTRPYANAAPPVTTESADTSADRKRLLALMDEYTAITGKPIRWKDKPRD